MSALQPPVLVAIVGGSGSGKTWAADRLAGMLGDAACRVSLDSFYRDRSHLAPARRQQINYDHPRSIDWPLVREFLASYRKGRPATLPQYDFATHCRLPQGQPCLAVPVLIMDGLWLLVHRDIRRLFDLSIFIECSQSMRLRQRLARDTRERGRSPESVRRQFFQTVAPMHGRWVKPQADKATIIWQAPVSIRGLAHVAKRLCKRFVPEPRNRARCGLVPPTGQRPAPRAQGL